MAVTVTTICNYALRLIGATTITAIDSGEKNADRCQDIYEFLRNDLLRSHQWNFATKYVKLDSDDRNATAPAHTYDYAYDLPADWLRTISCHDSDTGLGTVDFQEIEVGAGNDGVIATSVEEVYLKYIYLVTDVTRMPADFVMALQLALARDLAIPVANSNTLENQLAQKATRALLRAKSADALGAPPVRRPAGSWATSRQSWPSSRWPR